MSSEKRSGLSVEETGSAPTGEIKDLSLSALTPGELQIIRKLLAETINNRTEAVGGELGGLWEKLEDAADRLGLDKVEIR